MHAATIVAALDRLDTIVLVLGPPEQPGGVGTILAANTAFGRRVGGDPTHRNLGTLMLPETDQGSVDAVAGAVLNGSAISGELLLAGHSGPFWLGYSITTFAVQDDRSCCVLIGRDITDQMRRSDDDRALQRVLANAFRSVDAAVAVITVGGRLVTASQAFAALCGRPLRSLTGSALSGVLDASVLSCVQEVLANPGPGEQKAGILGSITHLDGSQSRALFNLSVIAGRADERLAVLTLVSEAAVRAQLKAPQTLAPQTLGKIHLIGLQEIRAVVGEAWAKIADRAMSLSESTIRRRLRPNDVLSRTSDQSFLIWFSDGTEEENKGLAARIARDVHIILLTEFADEVSVAFATVPLPPGSLPLELTAAVKEVLDRHPGLAPTPTVASARRFLAHSEKELPFETELVFGRSGQPLPAVWCNVPDSVKERIERAAEVLGDEALGAFEVDLLCLRGGLAVIATAVARQMPRSCFVSLASAILESSRANAALMEVLGGIDAAAAGRLTLLLHAPFPGGGATRLLKLAEPLSRRVRAVGLAVDAISDLPVDALRGCFSVVSFEPGALGDETVEADLWQAITVIHRHGAKVLARQIGTPRQARILLELGADFLCGTAPAAALS